MENREEEVVVTSGLGTAESDDIAAPESSEVGAATAPSASPSLSTSPSSNGMVSRRDVRAQQRLERRLGGAPATTREHEQEQDNKLKQQDEKLALQAMQIARQEVELEELRDTVKEMAQR